MTTTPRDPKQQPTKRARPAQPRICRACGQPFELPSLKSGEVCYRCAVRFDRQPGGAS